MALDPPTRDDDDEEQETGRDDEWDGPDDPGDCRPT